MKKDDIFQNDEQKELDAELILFYYLRGKRDKEFNAELILFYYLCGKRDKEFIDRVLSGVPAADCARMLTVCAGLRLKKLMMRMFGVLQDRLDEILSLLKNAEEKQICLWMDDFVAQIKNKTARREIGEEWEKRRAANRGRLSMENLIKNTETEPDDNGATIIPFKGGRNGSN